MSILDPSFINTGEPFLIIYFNDGTNKNFAIFCNNTDSHNIIIFTGELKQIDKIFIPDTDSSAINASDELINSYGLDKGSNIDNAFNKILNDIFSRIGEDYIILKDAVNGFNYGIQIRDGELITNSCCKYIWIANMPNTTTYMAGDIFDPSGMVVMGTFEDGSTREIIDYSFGSIPTNVTGSIEFVITYNKFGIINTVSINLEVIEFTPETILIDFEYTANDDGTYIITDWKGTYNGEPSTKLVVPSNNELVIM